jgi:hypothetical protein
MTSRWRDGRSCSTLSVVTASRPALLDLSDDRWCGVAMTDIEVLRALYACRLAADEYRRPAMEQASGWWPG